jgi:SprT protein
MSEHWQRISKGLSAYIPEAFVPVVIEWMKADSIHLHVVRGRKTKFGDYQPSSARKNFHRISINADLNPWEFLFTLTHEYAHLLNWKKTARLTMPHGPEWKSEYRILLHKLFVTGAFPESLARTLQCYLASPLNSTKSEIKLNLAVAAMNQGLSETVTLEEIPQGSVFILDDGRQFRKGRKIRTSYECYSIPEGKMFRVSPLLRVLRNDKPLA